MNDRKGIILAGGTGSRLWPITLGISKQLLPIYDKPMIYYPLTVLMLSGVREIAIITTPGDQKSFKRLLGDGHQLGVRFEYIVQPKPDGIAQAYILADEFLAGAPSVLVLGDNIFFGHMLSNALVSAARKREGATVFGYRVVDPERYGVVEFNPDGTAYSIEEKPLKPVSDYAITGLYFLDGLAPKLATQITPSARGELEITDLLRVYLERGKLSVEALGRGYAWLDTGTFKSLLDAGNFVKTIIERQGMQIGSPEEVAFRQGWITKDELSKHAEIFGNSEYGKYISSIL